MGRSSARHLAAAGAKVGVNYVSNQEAAAQVVQDIEKMGSEALAIQADVGNRRQVQGMVDTMLEKFGHIDILVHAAGIADRGGFWECSEEDWHKVMTNHLDSTFFLCQRVAKHMKERKTGRIIIFSSITATKGANAYAAAMGAKITFSRGLAETLAPYNIAVNTVSPGQIFTDMLKPFIPDEERMKWAGEKIPLNYGRFPAEDEVGGVVLFLASEMSRHITGVDIPVNGGQDIH